MQFARINDITLHYQHITAPEGSPVLVFSNSLATDFRIWRDVIVRLVGKAEIITYDNRGIADSLKGKVQDSVSVGYQRLHQDDDWTRCFSRRSVNDTLCYCT